jgi:hypothetical protein
LGRFAFQELWIDLRHHFSTFWYHSCEHRQVWCSVLSAASPLCRGRRSALPNPKRGARKRGKEAEQTLPELVDDQLTRAPGEGFDGLALAFVGTDIGRRTRSEVHHAR